MRADIYAQTNDRFAIPWGARVLFVLKHRQVSGGRSDCANSMSSGLLNSARFVADMLAAHGRRVKLVEVADNNAIDREVTLFRPDFVIIEALWVVPDKIRMLQALHPGVMWIIRNHSEIPFLAVEGCALAWIIAYLGIRNVAVASNSRRCVADLRAVAENAYPHHHDAFRRNLYLPNYYPPLGDDLIEHRRPGEVHIGCFGATRVMKNQLLQAVSALRFAGEAGLTLFFYMNAGRVEFTGDPVWKNVQALFAAMPQHHFVPVPWMDRADFLALLAAKIDIAMQVSFSETMNIVTADAVNIGIPVVASPEVFWLDRMAVVGDPNSGTEIAAKLCEIWHDTALRRRIDRQRLSLHRYAMDARAAWLGE